eukprot:gene3473-4362_t
MAGSDGENDARTLEAPLVPTSEYNPIRSDEQRQSRDVLFALIFVGFWAFEFYIGYQAFTLGNPDRLLYGTDYDGLRCGQKHPQSGVDFSSRKQAYFLLDNRDGNDIYERRVCVDGCPSKTVFDFTDLVTPSNYSGWADRSISLNISCEDEHVQEVLDALPSRAFVCEYNPKHECNYFDQLRCPDKVESLEFKGPCYPVLAPTSGLLNWCIPSEISKSSAQADNSPAPELPDFVSFVFHRSASASNTARRYISDVWKTLPVTLCCGLLLSALLSLVWVYFLRRFSGMLLYGTVLFINCISIGGTIFCYVKAGFLGHLALGSHVDIYDPSAKNPSGSDEKVFEYAAYVMTAVSAVILVCSILMLRKTVAVTVGCLEAAANALVLMPSILLVPLVPFLLTAALVAWFIVISALLWSAGHIVKDSDDDTYTTEWNNTIKLYEIYNAFALIWTHFFIRGYSN